MTHVGGRPQSALPFPTSRTTLLPRPKLQDKEVSALTTSPFDPVGSMRATVGDAFSRSSYLHSHKSMVSCKNTSLRDLLSRTSSAVSQPVSECSSPAQHSRRPMSAVAFSSAPARNSTSQSHSAFKSSLSPGRVAVTFGDERGEKDDVSANAATRERPASALLRATRQKLEGLLAAEGAMLIEQRRRAEETSAETHPALHDSGAVIDVPSTWGAEEGIDERLLSGNATPTQQPLGLSAAHCRPPPVPKPTAVPYYDTALYSANVPLHYTASSYAASQQQQLPCNVAQLGISPRDSIMASAMSRPLSAQSRAGPSECVSVSSHPTSTVNNNLPGPPGSTSPRCLSGSVSPAPQLDLSATATQFGEAAPPPAAMLWKPLPVSSVSDTAASSGASPIQIVASSSRASAASYASKFRQKLEAMMLAEEQQTSPNIISSAPPLLFETDVSPPVLKSSVAASSPQRESACDEPEMLTLFTAPLSFTELLDTVRPKSSEANASPNSGASLLPEPVELTAGGSEAIESFLDMHFFSIKSLDQELQKVKAHLSHGGRKDE